MVLCDFLLLAELGSGGFLFDFFVRGVVQSRLADGVGDVGGVTANVDVTDAIDTKSFHGGEKDETCR